MDRLHYNLSAGISTGVMNQGQGVLRGMERTNGPFSTSSKTCDSQPPENLTALRRVFPTAMRTKSYGSEC